MVGGWEVDSPRKRRESGVGPGARVRREGGWGGGEDAFEHDESGGVVGLVAVG